MNQTMDVKKKAKTALENYMKNMRMRVYEEQKDNEARFHDQVVSIDKRKSLYKGNMVDRIVFFLKGTGCSQIMKNGGCTCCGFYSISNLGVKIEDEFYKEKITEIVNDKNNKISDYKIVCLYNDGSILNEEEFSFDVLIYMIEVLNSVKEIEKIVIESKVSDITGEKLEKIRQSTDKDFEITIGYESSDEDVRQLCVNRPFTNKQFAEKVSIAKQYGISIVPLLMVKPAFLSEKEAVEDFINSLVFLEQYDLERIDMELPTVMKDTLNYDLWLIGRYKPITFWSVITILREKGARGLKTPLYISPMVYSVAAKDKAGNCKKCSDKIYNLFKEYNKTGDASLFDGINCECKEEWEQDMKFDNNICNLGQTVLDTLSFLN